MLFVSLHCVCILMVREPWHGGDGCAIRADDPKSRTCPLPSPPAPASKVSPLTEEDVARIAERERRHKDEELAEEAVAGSTASGSSRDTGPGSTGTPISSLPAEGADLIGDPPNEGLLVGVPVEVSPNVTKFMYAGMPGPSGRESGGAFDAEGAASGICRAVEAGGDQLPSCQAQLVGALTSR